MFRAGLTQGKKTPYILIMLMLSVLVTNLAYLDDYLGPIGISLGLPVEYVGLLPFFALACGAVGQLIAYRFAHIKNTALYVMIICAGALYMIFADKYSLDNLWIFGGGYIMFGMLYILLYSKFQDSLTRKYRPVFLSLYSIGAHIVYIGTSLIIGMGSTLGSWRYSILSLGLIIAALGATALLLSHHKRIRAH